MEVENNTVCSLGAECWAVSSSDNTVIPLEVCVANIQVSGFQLYCRPKADKHYKKHTNRFHILTLIYRKINIKHHHLKQCLYNLRYKIFHMYCCSHNTQRRWLRGCCLQLSHFCTQSMELLAHCFIFMFPFKLNDKKTHIHFRMVCFAKILWCCTYL